jgi:class 3 adenylate cyclase/tetratricopeptide (TPR) repeat protein
MPACGACGARAPDGARFCPACGARLAPEAQAESRRRVTVLFSDLAGSTELGENLDPETLRRVMARYFDEMRAVLERHGGLVEKFIGDAVMAVFGIPARREDDALRAVRAALEMRAAQERLNDELQARFGVRLGVRTGVNTGEVVAGDPGLGQAFVLGDAVNVAARLEQAAAEGEILVGADTERLVRPDVVLEPVAPLELKGKRDRVPAFRLAGGERPPAPDAEVALVGREHELAALHAAFGRCAERGSCELVTLLGAPGIGKSRLVRELATGLGERARLLQGRCLSYGDGGTYWPVAEIVRDAAGIGPGDGTRGARAKLATMLAGEEAADAVAGVLASMIGLDDLPHDPREASWAVRRLVRSLAAARPLVLVLDDLQWAEPALLDLIAEVAGAGDGGPALLIGVGRPELRELRPGLWGDVAGTALTLAPLGEADSRRLIGQLAGEAEPQVAARLTEAAGGNPLFVGELLRSLIEEGALARRAGRIAAVRPLDELDVPPTLEAVLAARLERLGADERTVAEGASVVGEEFRHAEVSELAPDPVRPRLDDCLAALVRHEVIADGGAEAFRFAHLLIRDVTYLGMLKERRAELHERFADWLERRAGDRVGEIEDILAFHLEQAYRYRASLAPVGERELQLSRRAHGHLMSAGQRALARLDRTGALKLFRAAHDLLPPGDRQRLEVRLEIANALAESDEREAAEREAGAVWREAEAAGEDDLALRARLEQVEHLTWLDPPQGNLALEGLPERAIARLTESGDHRGLARAWRLAGMREFGAGRFTAAGEGLATAIEHAKAGVDARAAREMWPWLLWTTLLWGPLPAGEAARRGERLLAESRGRPFEELHVRLVLCLVYFWLGRDEEARAMRRAIESAVQELGLAREAMIGDFFYGQGEWLAGRPDIAEPCLRHCYEAGEEGYRWTIALALAELLLDQARFDEAERLADDAAAANDEEDIGVEGAWRIVKSVVLAERGDGAEAERLAREAVAISEGSDNLEAHARAWLALARVLARRGRHDEAADAFDVALARRERKENLAGAAHVRAWRERLLSRPAGAR